jgi:hypothetical protein
VIVHQTAVTDGAVQHPDLGPVTQPPLGGAHAFGILLFRAHDLLPQKGSEIPQTVKNTGKDLIRPEPAWEPAWEEPVWEPVFS